VKVYVILEHICGNPQVKLVTESKIKAIGMFSRLLREADIEGLTEDQIFEAFQDGEYDLGDGGGVYVFNEEVE
jgi:hypothetical protein